MNYILPGLFALLILFALVLFVVEVRWLLYLREHHHDAWIAAGEPSILPFRPISEQRRLREFVTSETYRKFGDARLDALTRRVKFLRRSYVAVFTFVMLAAALVIGLQYSRVR